MAGTPSYTDVPGIWASLSLRNDPALSHACLGVCGTAGPRSYRGYGGGGFGRSPVAPLGLGGVWPLSSTVIPTDCRWQDRVESLKAPKARHGSGAGGYLAYVEVITPSHGSSPSPRGRSVTGPADY